MAHDKETKKENTGAPFILASLIGLALLKYAAHNGLFNDASTYLKMGGSYVLGLAAVAVLFTVVGFAVSAGWRLGQRLEKEEG
jgi:hypothetical protein